MDQSIDALDRPQQLDTFLRDASPVRERKVSNAVRLSPQRLSYEAPPAILPPLPTFPDDNTGGAALVANILQISSKNNTMMISSATKHDIVEVVRRMDSLRDDVGSLRNGFSLERISVSALHRRYHLNGCCRNVCLDVSLQFTTLPRLHSSLLCVRRR